MKTSALNRGPMTEVDQPKGPARAEAGPDHQSGSSPAGIDPDRWVEHYGDLFYGYAAARVRDPAIAQDLVQETFLAALKGSAAFAGRSSERAWLFGILRNKLTDYYRLQSREVALADLDSPLPEEHGAFCDHGLGKDGWNKRLAPKTWDTPEAALVSKEFREVLEGCLAKLPERVAQVFYLREMDGVASEEICKDLGLSPNNFWVMLHRARMGLRRCLELHWFGHKTKDE